MAGCCEDNDRTLDHAYTSSWSGVREVPLGCDAGAGGGGGGAGAGAGAGDVATVAIVAVGGGDVGDDTTSSVATGTATPLTTVSNLLSSSLPPESLSRAFMTSCDGGYRWIRLDTTDTGLAWLGQGSKQSAVTG